jgi:hypothetical protein
LGSKAEKGVFIKSAGGRGKICNLPLPCSLSPFLRFLGSTST